MKRHHFLVTAIPSQGNINPTLQLAKTLARTGAQVTFATTIYAFSRMKNLRPSDGLSFASFSDGCDTEESQKNRDLVTFLSDLKRFAYKDLTKVIQISSDEERPVTFLIYSLVMPWLAEMARKMQIPSAVLVIQCATAFAIYDKYYNGDDGDFRDGVGEIDCSSISMKLPDLPLFKKEDLPTFLLPNDQFFAFTVSIFRQSMKDLKQDSKACVLMNTFSELEEASIRAVEGMNLIPVGPLIPSAFSDGNDSADKYVGADLFDIAMRKGYPQWLDSKPERSVVYVSFGSLVTLKREQKIEILRGLKEAGRAYLLVIRMSDNEEEEVKTLIENVSGEEGMVVPWCSQLEVLFHRSVGCFYTHCGWNSTLECIVAGKPIVGFPNFSDQTTNAKMIEEVWGIGVRAKANEDGVVERDEIKRCLDIVMGSEEKGDEIRKNCAKWRDLAVQAVKENGSSHNSLKNFLKDLD